MVWSTPSDDGFHCFLIECKNLNKINNPTSHCSGACVVTQPL